MSKINKALKAKLWLLWYCVTDGTKGRQPIQKKIVAVTQAFEVAFHMTSRILLVFPVIAYGHGFLTLRLLMSYIYGAPILDVSRSHTTTHHSRTPLDE